MIQIEVGNSYSNIKGLSAADEKALRHALSYIVGGSSSHFSAFGPQRRSLLDKKGNFPTGLLHRVSSFLTKKLDVIVKDLRKKPMPGGASLSVDSYPWQNDALTTAIYGERGIISAPTGTGKSRVISLIASYFNLKTLIVVPSLEIKRQLAETLKDLKNITVLNIDSTRLKTATHYDVLIIDEGHHVAAKTYHKLNKTAWNNIYYRFFLTATPFRNDAEEMLLFEAIAGQIIYKLDYHTAIKEGYIVPIEGYYINVSPQTTDAVSWAGVYKDLVVNNTPRNVIIGALLARLHGAQKSTLCLVKEVAHGKILSEMTGLPFISGEDADSRQYIHRFSTGQIKVVIATTAMMGEGIDTKACEYVLVAGLGKAKSQFMQQVGRAVRRYEGKESAKIVLLRDKSHKYTLRHYNAQANIMKEEYNTKPQKLEVL